MICHISNYPIGINQQLSESITGQSPSTAHAFPCPALDIDPWWCDCWGFGSSPPHTSRQTRQCTWRRSRRSFSARGSGCSSSSYGSWPWYFHRKWRSLQWDRGVCSPQKHRMLWRGWRSSQSKRFEPPQSEYNYNYAEPFGNCLDVVAAHLHSIEEVEFAEDIEVDAIGLKIRFALLCLKKSDAVDAGNLFHDDGRKKLFYDSGHEEFLQTEGNFDSDFTATRHKGQLFKFWAVIAHHFLFTVHLAFHLIFFFLFLLFLLLLFRVGQLLLLLFLFLFFFFGVVSSLDFGPQLCSFFDSVDVAEQLTHQNIFDPLLDSLEVDAVLLLHVLLVLVC